VLGRVQSFLGRSCTHGANPKWQSRVSRLIGADRPLQVLGPFHSVEKVLVAYQSYPYRRDGQPYPPREVDHMDKALSYKRRPQRYARESCLVV
jgi:hypothetical protein